MADLTLVYQILHGRYDTQMVSTFNIVDSTITPDHAYKLIKHGSIDATKYFFQPCNY